ncbi:MAG: hypothetical protein NUK65_08340 [Firmicutes bacterium]|nr:hypothetical protein [Bacillota bacterium]
MSRKRKIIGFVVLLTIILFSLRLGAIHFMTIRPNNVKIAKLEEAMKLVKSDYNIRKVTTEYHPNGHLRLYLYTNQVLSDKTAKDLFKECAKAITDQETLTSIKETYVDRVRLEHRAQLVNPHLFGQDGYKYFTIGIYILNNSQLLYHFSSDGMEGNEDFVNWTYRNTQTGDTYTLTLSE